jgi:hypothetical protein
MIMTSPHQQELQDLIEQVSKWLTAIIAADLKAQNATPTPAPDPRRTAPIPQDLANQMSK